MKCPYGYILTGIKNELDNYEGKCCKFKISNNCRDINLASKLLDHKEEMVGTPNESKYLSPVAAKHVETLQRSNEQLVKLISIRQKDQTMEKGLSDTDKDQIFEIINSSDPSRDIQ